MSLTTPFKGILPAMQVPFKPDLSIDEAELRKFTSWLAGHQGITGLVTNGHTGEVFALTPKERAEVTRIVADEVAGKLPVVSGINCESITEAVEHAQMAKEAGASGLLVMPPHIWLRFGMRPEHVLKYFSAIGEAVDINLVVHIYPSWTKASYSSALLHEMAQIPWITTFKIGTREMSKYVRDISAIRRGDPAATIITCHDEYLLATMVQGIDGALVGFASFIPDKICELWAAVQAGDLKKAMEIQAWINPLKDAVYAKGEPSSDAHARMKVAMNLSGRMDSTTVRPPIEIPTGETYAAIEKAVQEAGLVK
jgi:4-hydroxy-tetrahydrodipicolinate synthase